jgi:hypothetical protein
MPTTTEFDTDSKRDNVFDKWYNIERAVDGPWAKFADICKLNNFKFTDLTFPTVRMILWFNFRPTVKSHDLLPIMENIFFEFKRLS